MIVSGPPGRLTSATMAVDRTKFLFWAPQLSVQKKVFAVTVCLQPHCFNVTACLPYLGIFHPVERMFHEKAQGFGLASFCHGKCGILLDLLPAAM